MAVKRSILASLLGMFTLVGCGPALPMLQPTNFDLYGAAGTKGQRGADAADWTVFVYMAADNSLSDFAAADLNEMEAGLTNDKVKVVVLVDQNQQGDSRIVEIKHDKDGLNDKLVSPVVDDHGAVIPADHEVDTGDPKTLQRFTDWGVKNYPSRRSMFVLWNHGGGAFSVQSHLKSFCWDDTSNHNLNLVDFWRTAQTINTKQKFDVIGFDMCLLGHIETAWQLRDLGQFIVSSEKTEPGDGWDYQNVMSTLSRNSQIYPRELSAEIVKGYNAYYRKHEDQGSTTISAMDSQKVKDRLVPAVNALAQDLQSKLGQPNVRAAFKQIVEQASAQTSVDPGEDQAIDLGLTGNLLTHSPALDAQTKQLATQMLTELQRSTVGNMTSGLPTGNYTGMKIYMDPLGLNADYLDASHQSFGTSAWAKLLKAYFKT